MKTQSPIQTESKPQSSFTPLPTLGKTGLLQRKCACGNSSGLTGKCSECQKKKLSLQRRAVNNQTESSEVPPIVHEVLRSPGQPLDTGTRTFMESRFGHDFSQYSSKSTTSSSVKTNLITDRFQTLTKEKQLEFVDRITPDETTPAPAPGVSPSAPAPSAPAPSSCAHPVNWAHTNPRNHGSNAIRVDISWGSSTGNLADLSNCTVREVVNYDPIPNPPFLWNPPNPTILTVPGTAGAAMDTHSYPPGLRNGITNPRTAGTMTAHQVYQYRCTGPGCSSNWTNIPGQAYTITREVFGQFVRLNPWRYEITKQGVGNNFNFSREVAIP